MKYVDEFKRVGGDKVKFFKLMGEAYPDLSVNTIERRFYDLRKSVVLEDFGVKPSHLKLLEADDMVRFGKNTIDNFKKYGFIPSEIDWLRDNGYLTRDLGEVSNLLFLDESFVLDVVKIDIVEKDVIELSCKDDFVKVFNHYFGGEGFVFRLNNYLYLIGEVVVYIVKV